MLITANPSGFACKAGKGHDDVDLTILEVTDGPTGIQIQLVFPTEAAKLIGKALMGEQVTAPAARPDIAVPATALSMLRGGAQQ